MLDIVTWLWKPDAGYRSQFTPEHANILQRMIERNYPHPHRFSCITDQTEGFSDKVRVLPLWDDFAKLKSPYGEGTPICYRRLKAFSGDMKNVIGKRFVSFDLDAAITGDLSPVLDRPEPFVIWGASKRRTPWNGSMWMMDAGAREFVWTRFKADPLRAIDSALRSGFYGSDQAWMNYALAKDEARWDERHGVYSYRMHIKAGNGALPPGAKVVFFEGRYNPWDEDLQKISPWIAEHYR